MLQSKHLFTLIITLTYQNCCHVTSQEITNSNKRFETKQALFYNVNSRKTNNPGQEELTSHQQKNPIKHDENNWKPIPNSRSMKIPERLKSRHLDDFNLKLQPISATSESRLWARSASQDLTELQVPNEISVTDKPKAKNSKIINEDAIMWMHYRPTDEILPYHSETENFQTSHTLDLNEDEKKYQYWLEYGLQNILNSTHDKYKKYPKNMYDIIDKINITEFKPLVTMNKRHTVKQTENSETEDPLLDLYESENQNYINDEQQTTEFNHESEISEQEYYKYSDEVDEKKAKSNKLIKKPIVIIDSKDEVRLTPEYYKKLLDSFGGEDNNYKENTKKNLSNSSEKNATTDHPFSEDHHATVYDRSRIPGYLPIPKQTKFSPQTASSPKKENYTARTERKIGNVKSETEEIDKAEFSDVLTIFKTEINSLIPKSFRTHIFLLKRLMVECYSDYDNENSNSTMIKCLKKISLKILDKAVHSDTIKITDSVSLIKENTTIPTDVSARSEAEWLPNIVEKIVRLFSTHSLKVQFGNLQQQFQFEGRQRHQFRRVFPALASIYMIISAVLIPLVFQLMAMMGGKSFVISQIALFVSILSIIGQFVSGGTESHPHFHHPPVPPPQFPSVYYEHHPWKKSDKRNKRLPINYSYYTLE